MITTASPKNFEYVKRLGASLAFDYNNATVVHDVIEAFKGKTLAGALAVGAGSAEACVDVVDACEGNKFVSMATYPISFEGELRRFAMVRGFLWSSARMWLKTSSKRIRTKYIFGSSLIHDDICAMIYVDYLPAALATGRFIAAPDPFVIGSGLEHVQAGLDVQRNGVSASKVVWFRCRIHNSYLLYYASAVDVSADRIADSRIRESQRPSSSARHTSG